jgi:tetratricopeptide (TPR) repeat protein
MLWPEDRAVHLLLAEALAGEGRWEAAEEALDGISGPGPTNAEIPLRVGSFRLQAGRVREAVTELESAYYMGSSHPDLPRTVGEAWLEIGDPERARVWFERWTSSSRDERAVLDLRVIEVALAAGEHDLAQAEARRLLDREETTVEIRARVFLLLGRLSWIEGREDEATARFLEAIDEGFEDPAWDGFLGSLFQGAGNLERARLHLERRADREEEDSRSRALLVSVLARLGRLGEARDELISFVEREGWSVEAEALAREITGAKP